MKQKWNSEAWWHRWVLSPDPNERVSQQAWGEAALLALPMLLGLAVLVLAGFYGSQWYGPNGIFVQSLLTRNANASGLTSEAGVLRAENTDARYCQTQGYKAHGETTWWELGWDRSLVVDTPSQRGIVLDETNAHIEALGAATRVREPLFSRRETSLQENHQEVVRAESHCLRAGDSVFVIGCRREVNGAVRLVACGPLQRPFVLPLNEAGLPWVLYRMRTHARMFAWVSLGLLFVLHGLWILRARSRNDGALLAWIGAGAPGPSAWQLGPTSLVFLVGFFYPVIAPMSPLASASVGLGVVVGLLLFFLSLLRRLHALARAATTLKSANFVPLQDSVEGSVAVHGKADAGASVPTAITNVRCAGTTLRAWVYSASTGRNETPVKSLRKGAPSELTLRQGDESVVVSLDRCWIAGPSQRWTVALDDLAQRTQLEAVLGISLADVARVGAVALVEERWIPENTSVYAVGHVRGHHGISEKGSNYRQVKGVARIAELPDEVDALLSVEDRSVILRRVQLERAGLWFLSFVICGLVSLNTYFAFWHLSLH